MTSVEITPTLCSQFKYLLTKIFRLPLWVKQALYVELKNNIIESSGFKNAESSNNKIVPLIIPKLTSYGKKFLINESSLEHSERQFLLCINGLTSILEIAQKNKWSLKAVCIIFLSLIAKGIVEPIDDNITTNYLLYITGEIRLGEFLVRTNKISNIQLDQALYSKKCAESFGEQVEFKNIISNLGYVDPMEISSIVAIKNSAEQIVDDIDDSISQSEQIIILQDEIDTLSFDNIRLKEEIAILKNKICNQTAENMELQKQTDKYSKGFLGKFLSNLQ